MINKAIILGRIGADAEVKTTGQGRHLATFNVATSKVFKNSEGQKSEKTSWHSVALWGKLAEVLGQYLRKGTPVYVEGEIDYQTWDKPDGGKGYRTVINADEIKLLGDRSSAAKPATTQNQQENWQSEEDVPY